MSINPTAVTRFKEVKATHEWEGWMYPGDHLSMDEAEGKILALGNQIIERDDTLRRFLCMQQTEEGETVWKCDLCPAYSRHFAKALEHERTHDADA